ncbi:PIN domain-containing protein [Mucilaginibacter sp. HMF5004]|uniref:type II toxin-antitoxin system VapC family toxin n=1 Tax=Mucilaginibacter rivuli TaxID=2857527 RepID=UPI001C5F511E|nr:PIN domain-containing protein [Mucilaginibacter rivuli]MBW4890491.1 PIN domain-containing protein [Mucilaginibacter rivuli]
MKQVFVDTNILIDLLANRQPFGKFAIGLFGLAEKNKVKLYTSSHSFATTHYLLKKYMEETALRKALTDLLELLTIVPVNFDVIKKSLLSNHKDFEDAIQIFAANSVENLDFIVTRNLKDFKNAGVTVLPPDELLNYL